MYSKHLQAQKHPLQDIWPIKTQWSVNKEKTQTQTCWYLPTYYIITAFNEASSLDSLVVCSNININPTDWSRRTRQRHMMHKYLSISLTWIHHHSKGNSRHRKSYTRIPPLENKVSSERDVHTWKTSSWGYTGWNTSVKSLWVRQDGPKVEYGQRLSNYLRLILL